MTLSPLSQGRGKKASLGQGGKSGPFISPLPSFRREEKEKRVNEWNSTPSQFERKSTVLRKKGVAFVIFLSEEERKKGGGQTRFKKDGQKIVRREKKRKETNISGKRRGAETSHPTREKEKKKRIKNA